VPAADRRLIFGQWLVIVIALPKPVSLIEIVAPCGPRRATIGVSACGGSSGGSSGGSAGKTAAAQSSQTASTASSSASAPAPSASSTTGAPAASGNDGSNAAGSVSDYKPSTIVSKHGGSTVLTSPDSVAKIGAYYKGVLAKGGWQVRSASVTAANASFTAHRTGEGVTISVYPNGSGSGISITTNPE
jgi:hypothetical protein